MRSRESAEGGLLPRSATLKAGVLEETMLLMIRQEVYLQEIVDAVVLQEERGVSFTTSGLFQEVHINDPGAWDILDLQNLPRLARTGNEGLLDVLTM
jgi:hypothetical protein